MKSTVYIRFPNGKVRGGAYRFSFNGQERDDEIAGVGNIMTAEFWMYDTRLGRRWNLDPVTYPWQSSYAVLNNCPIIFIDPNGLEAEEGNEPIKKGDKIETNKGSITASIDEAVVTAKKMSSIEKIWAKAKRTIAGSGEHLKAPVREYRSYGWTPEQNEMACRFMLNTTLGFMSGGLSFAGGRIANMGIDATSQFVASGYNYEKINATSILLAGALPGSLLGHAGKNIGASVFNVSAEKTEIFLYTPELSVEKVVFNATLGFAFDRVGAHYEGLANVNRAYITRMISLSYKPKMALAFSRYKTGVYMSQVESKVGLSAVGNILQNLK